MTTTEPVLGESGRELVREVLIHGPIARAELGRRLGLSPASLTRLSKPFLDRGLFVEGAVELAGAVGRPAKPLDVRVDLQRFVGIKLTGDQALGVLTDLRAKTLGEHVADLAGHSPEEVMEALAAVVEALAGSGGDVADIAGVGVSIGGKVTGQQVVLRAPFLEWREVDLGGMLSRRLGLPVVVENDVVALTEAERWFGLGRGIDDFAVVTTGAGVGYGLVIHGRQVITPDTGLGLGGHFPLDPTGPICADGHRGCSTAMLSTTSMCASAAVGLGRLVSYEELLALAASGNAVAVQVVGTAGRSLGRMIAAVANLTMVGTVVLSGEGIGLVDVPVAASEMRAGIAADRDPDASEVRVLTGDADFGAWARGAAAVAVQARIGALGA
ncbi:ROK family transcriptional regulator [Frigoribacterium sp. CFBP 13729]|uniref:ROK family transcriptional regulator n=1 Tax=unclassified Frigoribacterium TaxID=2627005 RepID=UPI00177F12EB|nr:MULTISPECIES: ROK family transcriptional regulator [unclassified Frigoribacterium]MBD8585665.1 ROK family transcriptional regulator [Frigoribacterium sp. CFBP 8766]MBD8611768.1 ROK family transcriptional regulator [Frigoribacterium sp. CFBP 13729]